MFKSRQQSEKTPSDRAEPVKVRVGAGQGDAANDQPLQEIEVSPEAAELVKQLQTELDEAVDARKRALAGIW